jgi:hypothetical protein
VYRVHHPLLSYRHDRTARALLCPNSNRAVPPQGGYFHGTSPAATASICEHGFDPDKWKGGSFGRGQYLSMDPAKAAPRQYTGSTDCRMLLVEACLGRVLTMERGTTRTSLTPEGLREAGYDSVAVPDTDEIVVYMRFQAIPRYVIHFERCEPSPALKAPSLPTVSYCNGRYEQRLAPADSPLGVGACARCLAHDTRDGGLVFLKLVADAAAAERERAALLAVGPAFAPALLDSFVLEPASLREIAGDRGGGGAAARGAREAAEAAAGAGPALVCRQQSNELRGGEVLVLEAAEAGESASLTAMCRRTVAGANGHGGTAAALAGAPPPPPPSQAASAEEAPSRECSACTTSSMSSVGSDGGGAWPRPSSPSARASLTLARCSRPRLTAPRSPHAQARLPTRVPSPSPPLAPPRLLSSPAPLRD